MTKDQLDRKRAWNREYMKRYRERMTPEKKLALAEYKRAWREQKYGPSKRVLLSSDERKARDAVYKREWAQRNAERLKEMRREKYQRTKAQAIAYATEWNRNNVERRREITRRHEERNPERRQVTRAIRRARDAQAEGHFTPADVRALKREQRMHCAHCAVKLTERPKNYAVDHVIPLARGGSNWPTNLQLLCRTCNARKGAKDPITFAQENGRLL